MFIRNVVLSSVLWIRKINKLPIALRHTPYKLFWGSGHILALPFFLGASVTLQLRSSSQHIMLEHLEKRIWDLGSGIWDPIFIFRIQHVRRSYNLANRQQTSDNRQQNPPNFHFTCCCVLRATTCKLKNWNGIWSSVSYTPQINLWRHEIVIHHCSTTNRGWDLSTVI